ncbi:rhodanese-like domain-containing protein [Aquabacterium sp.]|uniref:rhodanese-like domain-containing protein n=1 Tax=Aquabacterium sp. TaxID=1872578 RepID=UPI003784E4B4
MPLPDLYPASLGGDGVSMEPAMRLALEASFGGVEGWRRDFLGRGASAPVDARWLLMAFDPNGGHLVNRALVAGDARRVPLLALPLSGQDSAMLAREMQHIAWAGVYQRYQAAVHAASEPLAADADALQGAMVLDVRRAGVFAQAPSMIPGARWCDPATVTTWAAELPAEQPVVVYCVYGHEVGRSTAMRLRAAGVNARYLSGGIDGWTRAGRPVVDKPRA